MQELRPAALDERGLESALMDHLNAVQTRSSIECTIRSTLQQRLDPAQETVLFRVAQEALTNVARHAAARHAWVTLRAVGADAELTVRDDGVGFDIREIRRLAESGHFGLISMRERVETAGGTWELASTPGEGTMVRVRLPQVTLAAAEAE